MSGGGHVRGAARAGRDRGTSFGRPQAAPMVERHAVLGFAEEQLSMAIASLCRRWPRSDNPCFGNKTPNWIKPVDLIDRACLHIRGILPFAQCCRDARHHGRRDALDIARSRTVNMTAEDSDNSPGVLQSPPQPRHYFRCFEVERIRPHHNLKWRMVGEHRDRLGGLAVDHVNQMSDPLVGKSHPCCCLN